MPGPDCTDLRCRPMTGDDLPEALRIEREAYAFPWTEGMFRDCLRAGYLCWVAEYRHTPCGHGLLTVAAGECQVLNLCIAPKFQNRGLGRCFMERLMEAAWTQGAGRIVLEMRAGNQAARRLYRGLGFGEIGRRKGYYPANKGREDAIVLARERRA